MTFRFSLMSLSAAILMAVVPPVFSAEDALKRLRRECGDIAPVININRLERGKKYFYAVEHGPEKGSFLVCRGGKVQYRKEYRPSPPARKGDPVLSFVLAGETPAIRLQTYLFSIDSPTRILESGPSSWDDCSSGENQEAGTCTESAEEGK